MKKFFAVECAYKMQAALTNVFVDEDGIYNVSKPMLGSVILVDGTILPLVWVMTRSYEQYHDTIFYEVVENISYEIIQECAQYTFQPITRKDIGKSWSLPNGDEVQIGFCGGEVVIYHSFFEQQEEGGEA